MAWMERIRAAGAVGLVLLSVACSEDKPGDGNNAGDGDETGGIDVGEGDEAPADAGSRMDARIDATIETPPAVDAGDAGTLPPVVLPDGSLPPVVLPDAAVITTPLAPLPHDGQRGSICYGNGDCKGDDLKCMLPAGSAIPGFCVDDCSTDADCAAIDGVKGVCNAIIGEGLCQYPCGGAQNDGKGACPDDMVCENFAVGVQGALFPEWRCRYPAGGGKKTEQPWSQCDPLHWNGDCEGLNICHQPALSLASAALPHGYCGSTCTQDTDCKGPEGNTSQAVCWFGSCELNCGVPGGNCPTGMNCMDIDPTIAVATMRCIYID
ncbi:MAG: hypothetical protein ABW352_09050 [Polyangiales bacterium]